MKLVKTFHIQNVSDDEERIIHPKIIESLENDKILHTWKSSLVLAAYCMKHAKVGFCNPVCLCLNNVY